jgi:hypothetical protein
MNGWARTRILTAVFAAIMAMVLATPAVAGESHPRVLPPRSHPYGATYGQWGAHWWQWLYGTPTTLNPAFSSAGSPAAPATVDCSAGQRSDVWFLAGTFLPTSSTAQVARADVYRACTIPAGTALFFPLLNDEFDNLSCNTAGNPTSSGLTSAQLTALARTAINDIVPGSMAATIDGNSVSGLRNRHTRYRARSPWFSYTLPADNVGSLFGCNFPAGTKPPPPKATADGVYLMLAPLKPGTHVIHFGGETNVPNGQPGGPLDFIQNINYTITVTPGEDSRRRKD